MATTSGTTAASPGLPTIYHESASAFRKELAESAADFRQWMKPHQSRVFAFQNAVREGTPHDDLSMADRDAYTGCLMASNYAYALAAILGEAAKFGPEAQRHLAAVADDILMNGDDHDRNADVRAAVRCKHCHRPIVQCGKRAPHAGCASSFGWIHENGSGHACERGSDGPYATPAEATS